MDLDYAECLLYYSGQINQVIVTTEDHINIQFPAQFIRRFVQADGVHGRFRLVFDGNNKLVSLDRAD